MAVTRVASGHITGQTFTAANGTVDNTIDIGTCDFLIVSVSWGANNGHSMAAAPTWDHGGTAQAMTEFGAQTLTGSALRKHSFYRVSPTAGSHTLRLDPSAGSSDTTEVVIDWESFTGVDTGDPFENYNTSTATDGSSPFTSSLTITSATDDMVWVSHATRASGGDPSAIAPTNYTERHETLDGPLGVSSGDAAGAASVATTATFTSAGFSLLMNAHGVSVKASGAPPVGPVLSAESGTTNGSGVSTVTITSDDPQTTAGEVSRVTFVAGSVTKRIYVRAT